MTFIVHTTKKIAGSLRVPSSKSHSIRALIFAALANGTSRISRILISDDTDAARKIIEKMGTRVYEVERDTGHATLEVHGTGGSFLQPGAYDTGNSGIVTHFFLTIACVLDRTWPIEISCGDQMKRRPLKPLFDVLRLGGAGIEFLEDENHLPVRLHGTLSGGVLEVDGSSSQYVSALLVALPLCPTDSMLRVRNLCERHYVEMTTRWLDEQGIAYSWISDLGGDFFTIQGRQRYRSFEKEISGDFSSASYLIAAGVLRGGTVELHGLDMRDTQGDKKLIAILKQMGADSRIENDTVTLLGRQPLLGRDIDCSDIPDLVPTLAVICSQALGVSRLLNVRHARDKETDRLAAMTTELRKMGAAIEERDDALIISQSSLHGATVHGYGDHRTVMALTLAGMCAQGKTIIDTAASVSKTYPHFANDMKHLGVQLEVRNY